VCAVLDVAEVSSADNGRMRLQGEAALQGKGKVGKGRSRCVR
jgi:hypothetical protein